MKRMKKIASVCLAIVMMAAMTMNVAAATVTNGTGHTYKAYQVFGGTQAETDAMLGDVVWGDGVEGEALLSQLKADCDYFDECKTAKDVAEVLAGKADKCPEANALANAAVMHLKGDGITIAETVDLDAGYYLIVDVEDVTGKYDAKNSALLQVTNDGDIAIEKKYSVPTVDKGIVEEEKLVEAADANISDTITFRLTGTLPSNYADYETYTYIFHDTLSQGLTFQNDVIVKVGDKVITEYFEVEAEAGVITIACDNLKEIEGITADSKIIVEYTAIVNADAVIGEPGNPNTVYLEYSNNPNHSGEGTPSTGKTPEDTVLVFTYELDVTKTNGEEEADVLEGAKFLLYRKNGETSEYVTIDEAGKVTGWTNSQENASTLVSGADGIFKVIGLDAGTYYLEETVAPAGYNLLEAPITFEIKATVDKSENHPALTALSITVEEQEKIGNLTTGVVETNVINNAGTVLPETGGIGTTIFYIVGAALVLGAIVIFITRRRMRVEK